MTNEAEEAIKDEEIITLVCQCGADVSGPNEASVKEAMARHYTATGHSAASAPRETRRQE